MNSRPLYTLLTFALIGLCFGGCAATHTAIQIGKANKAVERAKEAGAQEHAIYEYTMATNYLRKSKEEAGYSDFKDSVNLATGAAEWADKAIIIIEKEGRGLDVDTLPGETRTISKEEVTPIEPDNTPLPEEKDVAAEKKGSTTPEETVQDESATPTPSDTPDAEATETEATEVPA